MNDTEVLFTDNAWNKIMQLVMGFDVEVGWHGTAHRDGERRYVIDDILVYPQTVTSVNVTADQQEYEAWLAGLSDDKFAHLRFHGHSHVNMDVRPSIVDLKLWKGIADQLKEEDFYICMIFNKSGQVICRVYDRKYSTVYKTLKFYVPTENPFEFFQTAKRIVRS